jgi:hypothetical protein
MEPLLEGSDAFAEACPQFREFLASEEDEADCQDDHQFRGTQTKHCLSPFVLDTGAALMPHPQISG